MVPSLSYVVPGAGWVIDRIGRTLTTALSRSCGVRAAVTRNPRRLVGRIVHYGELWSFLSHLEDPQLERNIIVATIYHGDRVEQFPELRQAMDRFLAHAHIPARIVTACRLMETRLLRWGVPRERLVRLPLGVDCARFTPSTPEWRRQQRARLRIPERAVCIGSFQKDGNGWGEGWEPKLIKGPDLFVDVVGALAKRYPICVLLTGPARGYVKRRLTQLGVPFRHVYPKRDAGLVSCYHSLDLYLITSREEGGPLALLESMATEIPLVSTRVGMAEDLIRDGENGALAAVDDVDHLVEASGRFIEEPAHRLSCVQRASAAVPAYDWNEIARQYERTIYRPLAESVR